MTDQQQTTDLVVQENAFSGVVASQQSRAVFLPASLAEAMQLAEYMAGGIGVRNWMRGNPSACLAVIQISMRWGLDPYIVANKSYYTNDTLSFESQLVNAVINTSGRLIGRLKVEFKNDASGIEGEETLTCRVTGRLVDDPDQVFEHVQPIATIKIRNSPLWKVNPRQQLQYHTTRAWARLYMPEVLLGIYTPDEIGDGQAQRIQDKSTPRDETPAPDRRAFEGREEDAQFEEIETIDPGISDDSSENGPKVAEKSKTEPDSASQEAENDGGAVDSPAENEAISGAQPASEEAGRTDDGPVSAEPGPVEAETGEALPIEPLEWGVWKRETLAAIAELTDKSGFSALRRRIGPAMDAADDDLAVEIQDALADKLATLPEKGQ